MRIILADLKGTRGFVTKDTIVGGYGSRSKPFSPVTKVVTGIKQRFQVVLSVQMAYLAAIGRQLGHEVIFTRGEPADGDVAIVLSSLVEHRHESAWADAMRARGIRTGFIGLAASKMPELFADHADFIISGEPEHAFMRLVSGERLEGVSVSSEIADLDELPFPRWDLLASRTALPGRRRLLPRPFTGGFPLLASRSCPEFCTYCPIRILGTYRQRSVSNIADELEQLCRRFSNPHVVFRDPLFSQDRDRCLALADEILYRGLRLTFECETRLDRLDEPLLDHLRKAGLRAICFGVETHTDDTLRKVARRPIPAAHQTAIVEHCRRRGITTAAQYVIGFLQDDWSSIAATIEYSIALGSTFAQFKILTPYPGTPLWKQIGPLVFERDWEQFDGFTPTFTHPKLSSNELQFLLGAAYSRFYMRPSWFGGYFVSPNTRVDRWMRRLDIPASARHADREQAAMSRAVVRH